MKKHKVSAIKLFFLFATLGAFPFLYPAMQIQAPKPMSYNHAIPPDLTDHLAPVPAHSTVLVPIDPDLGSEIKPDPIE